MNGEDFQITDLLHKQSRPAVNHGLVKTSHVICHKWPHGLHLFLDEKQPTEKEKKNKCRTLLKHLNEVRVFLMLVI
jgi:hypothetical protein